MSHLSRFLNIVLLCILSTYLSAQQSNNLSFPDQVKSNFLTEVIQVPQEKLYLQTDKPYYSAGEDIWFKGYLLNAVTNSPVSFSQFIYVELIDKCDSVLQRVKIRKDSLGFAGKIKLSPEIAMGYYTLRAYSFWMRNLGVDFFFNKRILIGNPLDDLVSSNISFSKPKNGIVTATIIFTDAQKKPLTNKKVSSFINLKGKQRMKSNGETNLDGSVSFSIKTDTASSKKSILEVSLNDRQLKYNHKFVLPSFKEDFDIQFFPEGGSLIENNFQTIAFKAIGSNGLSVDVTGNITDGNGEEYAQFKSQHKGLGRFVLNAQPNQVYYANVKTSGGLEKKVLLNPASTNGVFIQLKFNRDKIYYIITNKSNIDNQNLYLLVNSRGNVLTLNQLNSNSLSGQISESLFPDGIVSFSVLNELTGETLSERLAFISPTKADNIKTNTDKPAYKKNEEVSMVFNLKDKDSIPVNGNFSLSITDSHSVIKDSLADNILSNVLLTSDLKGYLEDPGSYFSGTKSEIREKLDLLMLTQGWKRFNTTDIVNGKIVKPKYYLEAGQALTGKVKNFFNKPVKNADVLMITTAKHHSTMFKTDSLGVYYIDEISFPDSTIFLLKAKKQSGLSDEEIIPDPDDFATEPGIIPSIENNISFSTNMVDYFSQSKEKYYSEGGLSMINLKEVTVVSDKVKKTNTDNYYSGMAEQSIGLDKLSKMKGRSVFNALFTIPGLFITGNSISVRGSRGMPLVLFDNMELAGGSNDSGQLITELKATTTDEVEDISVFEGASAAIFGARGANGVITISSRKGGSLSSNRKPLNMICVTPLGYQKPSEFYVPKFDVSIDEKNRKPDLRTTIYWNPFLTTDTDGKLTVKFPTADKNNDYDVVLEGVSATGEVYRYSGIVRRK